jgi:hypothetical protein
VPAPFELLPGVLVSPPTPLPATSGLGNVQPCIQSLDGSEAWVQGADLVSGRLRAAGLASFGYPGASGPGPVHPFLPANPPSTARTLVPAPTSLLAPTAPATWSPFGGPYLDEYDLVAVWRQGPGSCVNCLAGGGQVPGSLFKVWGEAASGGFPFVPVSTGFVPAMNLTIASSQPVLQLTRATPGNRSLLLSFNAQGNGSGTATEAFVVQLGLAGRTPPQRPLP